MNLSLSNLNYFILDVNQSQEQLVYNQTSLYRNLIFPSHYETSYRIIGSLVMIFIFLVGTVGNTMVILVVFKTKNMRSPTNCYLVSLAFADLLLLLSATLPTIVEFHLLEDQFIGGKVACPAMVFSQYLGFNLSSLSITALTAERYVAICRPMKAHVLCTVSRAKKIIVCLWVFGCCYSAPWLGLTSTRKKLIDIEECTFTLKRDHYLIYYLADLFVMYLVPVIINIVLYTLISSALYKSNPLSTAIRNSSHAFGVVAATASVCKAKENSFDHSSSYLNNRHDSFQMTLKSPRLFSQNQKSYTKNSVKTFCHQPSNQSVSKFSINFTNKSLHYSLSKCNQTKFSLKTNHTQSSVKFQEDEKKDACFSKEQLPKLLNTNEFVNLTKKPLLENELNKGSSRHKVLHRQNTMFHEIIDNQESNKQQILSKKKCVQKSQDKEMSNDLKYFQPSQNFSNSKLKSSFNLGSFTNSFHNKRSKQLIKMPSSMSTSSSYGNTGHSRTQIIKMLVVVVSLFAILWLPYRAYVVFNSFKKPRFENLWLMFICRTMVHANSAINPILYNVMSIKFKQAFKNLLRCGFLPEQKNKKKIEKLSVRRVAVNCNKYEDVIKMYKSHYKNIISRPSQKK